MSDSARKIRTRWIVFLSALFLLILLSDGVVSFLRQDAANKALVEAVGDQDIAGVRLALRRGADPNCNIYDSLLPLTERLSYIFHKEELPKVPVLVYAIEPDKIPLTDPDPTIARLLLKAGANPNGKDDQESTPLMTAASWGMINHVRLLLASGAQVDARNDWGHTALYNARAPSNRQGPDKQVLERRKKEAAELLIQAGAKE